MANKKKPVKGEVSKLPKMTKEPIEAEVSTFEHPLERAYTIVRRGSGWSVVSISVKGDVLVEKTYTEPDAKNVAQERLLILYSKDIMGG